MPLLAAAVCPHPPLIVPEVAAGAAAELAALRDACASVVDRLARSGARRLVIVGSDLSTVEYVSPFQASFAPWGVDVVLREGTGPRLPLSLLVGLWLARDVPVSVVPQGIRADADVAGCVALGAELAASPAPWALLAMGDGSACHGQKSPGYEDPRADSYDNAVASALASADTATLRNLDPVVSTELLVAGRPAWQVLAGAVDASGSEWRGDLTYADAPYGVGYFVAFWEPVKENP